MSLGLSPKSPLERSLLAREGSLGRAEGELPGASCFCSPSEGALDGITLLKGGPGPGAGQSHRLSSYSGCLLYTPGSPASTHLQATATLGLSEKRDLGGKVPYPGTSE